MYPYSFMFILFFMSFSLGMTYFNSYTENPLKTNFNLRCWIVKSHFVTGGQDPYHNSFLLDEFHLWSKLATVLRYRYSLFSFFPVLANFHKQTRQHFVMTNTTVATQASRNPITSREWYWNQVRLWEAGRRCLAPLWRMTNSIQKTARSRGFIGWLRWMVDNHIAFSL